MATVNLKNLKNEIVHFIRNSNILPAAVRGATTTTATGTFTAATSHLLNVKTVKNIRSIVVGGNTLAFGTDYTYVEDYNTIDSCDATTGWEYSAKATAPATDTTNYKQGSASIKLGKTSGASFVSYNKTITSRDMSSSLFSFWLYVKDSTALAKLQTEANSGVNIMFYSTGTNQYKSYNVGGRNTLSVGWNLLTVDILNDTPYTTGGTFVSSDVIKILLTLMTNNDTDTFTSGDILMDYYYLDTNCCYITFNSAQTGAYTITYDYGSDKIYTDLPRVDLTLSSYPRIGLDIVSFTTSEFGIGGSDWLSQLAFSVYIYDESSENVESYHNLLRSAFQSNAKNFHYMKWLTPSYTGRLSYEPNRNEKIKVKPCDYIAKFILEGI